MPEGYDVAYPKDSTEFIKISVEDVIQTLFEAIILVVVVMYLFLQNIRATLIPALAVPVVLLGTFGVLALFGYSINTLTLFAMVLAIGLLVDDAIVVVENVERIMRDEGLPAREATEKSMGEISGALVAIALVLSAVFLPMAFFGGSTGVIYRQFSVTIISAMFLSVVVALTLTPALCGSILSHTAPHKRASSARLTASTAGPSAAIRTRCCAPCAVPAACWLSMPCSAARWASPCLSCRAASCQRKIRAKSWCSTPCPPARRRYVPPKSAARCASGSSRKKSQYQRDLHH
jgi:multidrug efflux pump subunit AcrB